MTETHVPDGKKTAILVLGMHRSGTSVLNGALTALGCAAPATPIPPNEENEKGFFESRPVARLDDRVLKAAKRDWTYWQRVPLDWFHRPERRALVEEGVALIEAEFGTGSVISIKDPRICLLVPFWLRVLQESGREPVAVHTHRHPMEVANSLSTRNGLSVEHALLLWLGYNLQAELQTRSIRRVFASYDTLIHDPLSALTGVIEGLEVLFPSSLEDAGPEITGLVDRSLRHHEETAQPALPALVAEVHATLDRWAVSGEDAEGFATLDRIRHIVSVLFARLGGLEENAADVFEALYLMGDAPSDRPDDLPGSDRAAGLANHSLRIAFDQAAREVAQLKTLRSELAALRAEHKAMVNSLSWRWTRPLRWLRRLGRRTP